MSVSLRPLWHCLYTPVEVASLRLSSHTTSTTFTRGFAFRPSPSVWARQDSQRSAHLMRDDFGIFDHYVPPKLVQPVPWSQPKQKFRDLYRDIKNSIINLVAVAQFKSKIKPETINFRDLRESACELHVQMNTAFAEGDRKTLQALVSPALFRKLEKKVQGRKDAKVKGDRMEWKLHRMLSQPKLVCFRAAKISAHGDMLAQAIVRIHSEQSVTRWQKGRVVPGSGQPAPMVEYIVVQHRTWELPRRWYIQGQTHETPISSDFTQILGSGLMSNTPPRA